MKKLVFSEKENRYIELEYTLDNNNQKVYNEEVQGYDLNGNPIKVQTELEIVEILENKVLTVNYAKNRIKICKDCEHYRHKFCRECSCFLPIKVLIKGASCPLKKWNAINE